MTAKRVHVGVELTLRTPRHLRELLSRHAGGRRLVSNWCKAHDDSQVATRKEDTTRKLKTTACGFHRGVECLEDEP